MPLVISWSFGQATLKTAAAKAFMPNATIRPGQRKVQRIPREFYSRRATNSLPAWRWTRPATSSCTLQSYGQDGNGYGVYAQAYDSLGTPQGSEFLVNTYTPPGTSTLVR